MSDEKITNAELHDHAHEHKHSHAHEHEETHCSGCGCHCHDHDSEKSEAMEKYEKASVIIGVVLFALSFIPVLPKAIGYIFLIAAIIIAAVPVLIEAFEEIKGKSVGENVLLVIAIISACALADFSEAAAVILLFRIGEALEDYAINRSKRSINELSEIRPDTARLCTADGERSVVSAQSIKIGDIIEILPFERVPLDGEIVEGESSLDSSAVTGESIPVEKTVGDKVLSGMINGNATLQVKVSSEFADSTASRIIDMVQNASSSKAKSERIITRFARYYTPIVVACAALLAVVPPLVTGDPFAKWIERALVFLVASCPCAFVISVPLSFFAGIGAASKKGILVKGGTYVELLEKPDAVVFDKTGTLTTDEFEVKSINPASGVDEKELLEAGAYAEYLSSHPISSAIVGSYGEVDESLIKNFSEIQARGTSVEVNGKKILCGGKRLMDENSVDISTVTPGEVYVAKDGKCLGSISVEGRLRPDSKQAIKELKELGVKRVVMLTGDNENAAKQVAEECGIDEYHAGLLPEGKIDELAKIQKESGCTVFVGDGINDAPSLALSDVGVAMGLGTDAAIEAGDVVLMNSSPSKLAKAISLFRKTMSVTRTNIIFAIVVKAAVLLLGAFGIASMWAAVFADVGVTVIAVLNSSRLMMTKKEK